MKEILLLPYFLLIPLSIYGNIWFRVKVNRRQMFAAKRSMFLSYGLNLSLLCGVILSSYFLVTIFYINLNVLENPLPTSAALLYMLSFYLILYFLIIRTWLLHFRYKFNTFTLQLRWQQLINSNIIQTSQKTNWYIRNNHKYGNMKYVAKRLAITMTPGYICFISNLALNIRFLLIPGIILTLSYIVFYITILCKTPYAKDTYFMHWESKMHSRVLLICIVTMFVMIIVNRVSPFKHPYIIVGMIHISVSSVFCGMILISTYIIIRKNTTNVIIRHKSLTDGKEKYTVELLLSNEESVNLFMVYMAKELSYMLRFYGTFIFRDVS